MRRGPRVIRSTCRRSVSCRMRKGGEKLEKNLAASRPEPVSPSSRPICLSVAHGTSFFFFPLLFLLPLLLQPLTWSLLGGPQTFLYPVPLEHSLARCSFLRDSIEINYTNDAVRPTLTPPLAFSTPFLTNEIFICLRYRIERIAGGENNDIYIYIRIVVFFSNTSPLSRNMERKEGLNSWNNKRS